MSPSFLQEARKNNLLIEQNVLLAPFTTIKIGGPAQYFSKARNREEIITLAHLAKKQSLTVFIIGKGANILIADQGVKGLTILNTSANFSIKPPYLTSDSGVSLGLLINKAVKAGLSGLETLAGVPASFGGAIHHNAGTKLGEIKDVIESVEIFNQNTGETVWLNHADCQFHYRGSMFSKHRELLILQGKCKLSSGDPAILQQKLQENLEYKHRTQTYNQPTSGCTFKNYQFRNLEDENIARKRGLGHGIENHRLHTGWLIDHLGFKGYTLGQAQVSTTHANFIMNLGRARAEQVIMLISMIKQKARDAHGLQLHEEIEYIGF